MRQSLADARSFWPFYVWAWLYFPILVLAVRFFGISLSAWWAPVTLFSLVAGIVPWVPWGCGRIGYSANALWAIFVPLVTLLLSVTVASALDAA